MSTLEIVHVIEAKVVTQRWNLYTHLRLQAEVEAIFGDSCRSPIAGIPSREVLIHGTSLERTIPADPDGLKVCLTAYASPKGHGRIDMLAVTLTLPTEERAADQTKQIIAWLTCRYGSQAKSTDAGPFWVVEWQITPGPELVA